MAINCYFPPEQTDGSSIWIALDGWGLTLNTAPWTDILQAGTETDVPCSNGPASQSSAYFWIEWNGTKNITTWPVNVGDQIHVRIAATTTGPNAWQEATVYLDNLTTQQSRSITFHSGCLICGNPPVPATLFGNTAEWVVETTFYSATDKCWLNTLNDFGIVQITNMSVTDNQRNYIHSGQR
jgi:Peptidase A4 family